MKRSANRDDRETLLRQLEDIEDVRIAEEVLDRIRRGVEKTIPLQVVLQRFR